MFQHICFQILPLNPQVQKKEAYRCEGHQQVSVGSKGKAGAPVGRLPAPLKCAAGQLLTAAGTGKRVTASFNMALLRTVVVSNKEWYPPPGSGRRRS